MKLTKEQLQSVLTGAVELIWQEDGVVLHRFKEIERRAYEGIEDFQSLSEKSTGITLDFHTDSEFLRLRVGGRRGRLRPNLPFEVYVDGVLESRRCINLPADYREKTLPVAPMDLEFPLPGGEKRVTVYFPWHITVKLYEVELSCGASLRPHVFRGRWLALGDSITQGYDVAPSLSYINQTARLLDYQVVNHAISGSYFGEMHFVPELAEDYDLVTVAFGTNDYLALGADTVLPAMGELFSRLAKRYPTAKVVILLPIWRKAEDTPYQMGTLPRVRQMIRTEAEKYPNFIIVDGRGFVPHHADFYGESELLHPNELGATHYAMNLYKTLRDLGI